MIAEKTIANDHVLTQYALKTIPNRKDTIKAVCMFANEPDEQATTELKKVAPMLRELYRECDDIVKAITLLKTKIEWSVGTAFEEIPSLQKDFKIQQGSKTIKCDADENSMYTLMERYIDEGLNPSALFSLCGALTSKKVAEAFGLSEQALLEKHGDLFATHYNKNSVKML